MYEHPTQLLQRLIRFNTTNPPGNELECVRYIQSVLEEVGIESTIVAKDENRPNLVARLKGSGRAAPLLLQGHVDVVTTAHQDWKYPPFEATEAEGFIWGRGALDMKSGVTMMLAAFARAKAEGLELPGDVILTVLSDEEVGGEYGARYLVEQHAHLFEGVRYSLGEFGGFTMHLHGKRFYPIQVLEKQCMTIEAILTGPGGHGAFPLRGGAMAKLGTVLQQLDRHRLPVHIHPVIEQMVQGIAGAMPQPIQDQFLALLDPNLTDQVLDGLGELERDLAPLLHNTVSTTMVHGGTQFNVIPSRIVLTLDGRILPGFTPEEALAELREVIGQETELNVTYSDPGSERADLGLYPLLSEILQENDPDGVVIPYMMPAVTDGRFFARLGIQNYGFLPVQLPEGFRFLSSIHAANERIPVGAVETGTEAVYQALLRLGKA